MGWFKEASNNKFIKKIKEILKSHPFVLEMSKYYNIPLSEIDTHLKIQICDLKGKFAEGNGKLIRIDKNLLNKDFFKENFHFIIHEFFHWLKRRSEDKFYFNDPEEVQSFVIQMTWQLIEVKNEEDIIKNIYPIVQNHFNDKEKSKKIFKEMINKSLYLFKVYKNNKNLSI